MLTNHELKSEFYESRELISAPVPSSIDRCPGTVANAVSFDSHERRQRRHRRSRRERSAFTPGIGGWKVSLW